MSTKKTKAKTFWKKVVRWWKTNETVKWLKEKITIKRVFIFLSVSANIIMFIILVASM